MEKLMKKLLLLLALAPAIIIPMKREEPAKEKKKVELSVRDFTSMRANQLLHKKLEDILRQQTIKRYPERKEELKNWQFKKDIESMQPIPFEVMRNQLLNELTEAIHFIPNFSENEFHEPVLIFSAIPMIIFNMRNIQSNYIELFLKEFKSFLEAKKLTDKQVILILILINDVEMSSISDIMLFLKTIHETAKQEIPSIALNHFWINFFRSPNPNSVLDMNFKPNITEADLIKSKINQLKEFNLKQISLEKVAQLIKDKKISFKKALQILPRDRVEDLIEYLIAKNIMTEEAIKNEIPEYF
jgi:hypothetical protein